MVFTEQNALFEAFTKRTFPYSLAQNRRALACQIQSITHHFYSFISANSPGDRSIEPTTRTGCTLLRAPLAFFIDRVATAAVVG